MKRDVYSGRLRLLGEEHPKTLLTANNYASTLLDLNRYAEVKSLMRKSMPVARRVFGESHELTLRMGGLHATALCRDTAATLDDVREAVTMLEEDERIARRVFGGGHPLTVSISRAALAAREASFRAALEAMGTT